MVPRINAEMQKLYDYTFVNGFAYESVKLISLSILTICHTNSVVFFPVSDYDTFYQLFFVSY